MGSICAKNKKQRAEKDEFPDWHSEELEFYETSDEQWIFGKKHLDELQQSLQIIELQMMEEIILEYLGEVNESEWSHPNYTTYTHVNGTPLGDINSGYKLSKQTTRRYATRYVTVVGKCGVGKSALIRKFTTTNTNKLGMVGIDINVPVEQYDECDAELEMALAPFHVSVTEDGPHPLRNRYEWLDIDEWTFDDRGIFFLVFSVVDKESFDYIQQMTFKGHEQIRIVVGNKCDLRIDQTCNNAGNAVDMDEVFRWCKWNHFPYIEVSAKTGKNINLLFRQCLHEFERKMTINAELDEVRQRRERWEEEKRWKEYAKKREKELRKKSRRFF